jgi:hypothetical protein
MTPMTGSLNSGFKAMGARSNAATASRAFPTPINPRPK